VADALARPVNGLHIIDLASESPRDRIVLDAATAEILEAHDVPAASRFRGESPAGGRR